MSAFRKGKPVPITVNLPAKFWKCAGACGGGEKIGIVFSDTSVVLRRMKWILPLFACCGLLLAGCVSPAPAPLADGTVQIPEMHLKLKPEPGWRALAYREGRDYYKNFRSTNTLINAAYYHEVSVPFLMLERTRQSEQGYRTLFTVDRGALNDWRFMPSEKLVAYAINVYIRSVPNVIPIGGIRTEEVAGQTYATVELHYPLGFKDGRKFQVVKHFWVRTTGISAVVLSAEYDSAEGAEVYPEVLRMLQSVAVIETAAKK